MLRAHVGDGAHELAHVGMYGGGLNVGVGGAGHAKIENLGLTLFGDEDIARLQIAMNDPLLVGMLDRIADLGEQFQALAGA